MKQTLKLSQNEIARIVAHWAANSGGNIPPGKASNVKMNCEGCDDADICCSCGVSEVIFEVEIPIGNKPTRSKK